MVERFFDSHAHLCHPKLWADREQVIQRSSEKNVTELLCVGYDIDSSRKSIEIAHRFPGVFASVGISPHDTAKAKDSDWDELAQMLEGPQVVACGETGLDYHYMRSPMEVQKQALRTHLELAKNAGKPVIVHTRDSEADLFDILEKDGLPEPGGVLHCFTSTLPFAQRAVGMGLLISFSGILTFGKANALREIPKFISTEFLLVETDAPYLAPTPYRGKRCEPFMVPAVAAKLAESLGLTTDDVARVTRVNAHRLFQLKGEEPSRIAYPIRNALYLNVTNQCSNACAFCVRNFQDGVKGHRLHLDRDPSYEQVIREMEDFTQYDEVVFCGFGEPTCRLELILKVADYVRSRNIPVRLNTNGQGNLIAGRNIVPDLQEKIDKISVSLNTAEPEQYVSLCRPRFGEKAHPAVLDFIRKCRQAGIDTIITVVDLAEVDIPKVRQLCKELDVPLRIRHANITG